MNLSYKLPFLILSTAFFSLLSASAIILPPSPSFTSLPITTQLAQVTSTPSLCTTYTNTSPIPQGYGAPYNLFSTAKELLLSALCNTNNTVTLTSGNGANTTYIWSQAYYTRDSQTWTPITLTGSQTAGNGQWIIGTANTTVPLTTTEQANQNYYASYVCTYQSNTWKCGCSDTTCATPKWNLQGMKKTTSGGTGGDGTTTGVTPDIYVSLSGSDQSSGASLQNAVKTLAKAVSLAKTGDIIYLSAGTYDLGNQDIIINNPISIIGESKTNTILSNGKHLVITKGGTIKNVTLTSFSAQAIELKAVDPSGVNGVTISGVVFDGLNKGIGINSDALATDIFTNILVENSEFKNGFLGIELAKNKQGTVSNVTIKNNSFSHMGDPNKASAVVAITVGDNENRFRTHDIWILNNTFNDLQNRCYDENGDDEWPPVHAIWSFGSYIHVIGNTISNTTHCKDHEAIYLKANYSEIVGNMVTNTATASMDGDIIIKSSNGYQNIGNSIKNNTITNTASYAGNVTSGFGQSITAYGETIITGNTIRKYGGRGGIFAAALNAKVTIENNSITLIATDTGGINLRDPGAGTAIQNNTIKIERAGDSALDTKGSVIISNNESCIGTGCTNL